jgi:hypothetical protein
MIDGYRFPATCPDCGGHLDHRTSGSARDTDTYRTADVFCGHCLVVWRVETTMVVVDDLRPVMATGKTEADMRRRAGEALGADILSTF